MWHEFKNKILVLFKINIVAHEIAVLVHTIA